MEHPDIEHNFEEIEERNKGQNNVQESISGIDHAENYPIGHPQSVILSVVLFLFHSLESHVSRVQEADGKGKPRHAIFKNDEKRSKSYDGKGDVSDSETKLIGKLGEDLDPFELIKV